MEEEELQEDIVQDDADKTDIDPGQQEGKEKKNEPPPDSKRWDKVYGRMKQAERTVDEFKKQLEERDKQYERDLELIRKHNEQLLSVQKPDPVYSPETDDFKTKIRDLKSAKIQAKKDLDWDREALIEDQIEDLKERLERQERENFRSKVKKEAKQEAKVETVNDELLEWQANTAWFNTESDSFDPLMRGAAIEMDNRLLADKKWAGKPLKARLNEVRKIVEERFRWNEATIKGKIPSVEGAGGVQPRKTESTTLSEDEKRVAQKMFREKTPEEAEKIYAEQKRIIARGR